MRQESHPTAKVPLRHDALSTRRIGEAGMPSTAQLVVWIIVGLLAGSLAGLVTTWRARGFGLLRNLALGLVGALIGGFLFRLFDLWPALALIAISLRDVVSAFLGTLALIAIIWLWMKFRGTQPAEPL
jgi:uncharacterized membrane protein YeaQ/YmgE (transglycosylase-associated protein family)